MSLHPKLELAARISRAAIGIVALCIACFALIMYVKHKTCPEDIIEKFEPVSIETVENKEKEVETSIEEVKETVEVIAETITNVENKKIEINQIIETNKVEDRLVILEEKGLITSRRSKNATAN